MRALPTRIDLRIVTESPNGYSDTRKRRSSGKCRMKLFCLAIVVTGLVTAFALPAFAANHSIDATMITCADFTAMDADAQMKAMAAMHMASEGMTSDEMASDEMASDQMATDEMATDEMASNAMIATAATCESTPDMMAMDAMMSN